MDNNNMNYNYNNSNDNNNSEQNTDSFYSYHQNGGEQNAAGTMSGTQGSGSNTNSGYGSSTAGSGYTGAGYSSTSETTGSYTNSGYGSNASGNGSYASGSSSYTGTGYGNGYTGSSAETTGSGYTGAGYGSTSEATGSYTNSGYGNNASGSGSYGSNMGVMSGSAYDSSYSNNAYGNSNYGAYQSSTYQNGADGQNGTPETKEKKKREKKVRKPGGFGMKLVKCASLALVFGLVSGTAIEGIHLISNEVFEEEETATASSGGALSTSDSGDKVEATATATSYVVDGVADIVDEAMPSIVAITNVSETEYQSFWGGATQTYESTSAGSGIIVSQDDNYLYIATNNHVVDGATSLTVAFYDNATVSAEIKGTDPSTDLAVIRVELDSIEASTMEQIKVATLGDSDALRVGEFCIAIGNALGYGQSVTGGYISALNREVSISDSSSNTYYTAELIQTDAAINPGNSGGALLNAAGEVIGINSVKYSDTSVEGIGYAIPINTAIPIIEDLITKEKVDESESAYLGVAGVDVTSDVSATYNMPTGVYVAQVTSGSSAEAAGIQTGDIITEFDGRTITSMEELASVMEYYSAGTTVDVTIQRASNGEYVEQIITVTLGKKN